MPNSSKSYDGNIFGFEAGGELASLGGDIATAISIV